MRSTFASAVVVLVVATLLPVAAAAAEEPVAITDVYIEMDDGVRLAADVYLPPGTPTDGTVQVPCLVELTPYRKENRAAEAVSLLPGEGFGVIEVDVRGTGGSEGEYDIVFSVREQWDAAQVIDWAAERSGWCTDRVGMFGGSYSGIIQYLTASLPPERAADHLAAIAPQRAYGDLYRDIVYHGGQLIGSFGAAWSSAATTLYAQPPTNLHTVQGVTSWSDHLTENDPMWPTYMGAPYADATYTSDDSDPEWTQQLYRDSSVLTRIEHLEVPTLHLAGWFDTFTRGQLLTFQAARERERDGGGPHYLIVGPWNHAGTHFVDPPHHTERLVEWYRHWLDDGPEPAWFGPERVLYYELGEGTLDDDTGAWRTARDWPPPTDHRRLHLREDGSMTFEPPTADEGTATYVYDPTTGPASFPSRWDNAVPAVPHPQHDQRLDGDRAGLTFQTAPVGQPLTFAGPLMLRLHAATEGVDGGDEPADGQPPIVDQVLPPYHDTDLVVKVSDVAPDGTAYLLTEGFLRASHRAVDRDRSQIVDGEVVVPFHPHTRASVQPPVPGEIHEYLIEVWPTAKSLQPGHRLRVDIHSSDTPNHLNLLRPAVTTVSLDAQQPSYLLLPVTTTRAGEHDASTPAPTGSSAGRASGTGPLPTTGAGLGLLGASLLAIGWALRPRGRSGRGGRTGRRRRGGALRRDGGRAR